MIGISRMPVAGGMLPIAGADGAVLLTREAGSHMPNELAISVHVAPGLFVWRGRHGALLDPAPLFVANRRGLAHVESPQYPAASPHKASGKVILDGRFNAFLCTVYRTSGIIKA
jgi:hypothetical protein